MTTKVNILYQCFNCKNHTVIKNGVDGISCNYCNGPLNAINTTNLPTTRGRKESTKLDMPVKAKVEKDIECEHNYITLDEAIVVQEVRSDGEIQQIIIDGWVVFHCTKCLDIQKKVI